MNEEKKQRTKLKNYKYPGDPCHWLNHNCDNYICNNCDNCDRHCICPCNICEFGNTCSICNKCFIKHCECSCKLCNDKEKKNILTQCNYCGLCSYCSNNNGIHCKCKCSLCKVQFIKRVDDLGFINMDLDNYCFNCYLCFDCCECTFEDIYNPSPLNYYKTEGG